MWEWPRIEFFSSTFDGRYCGIGIVLIGMFQADVVWGKCSKVDWYGEACRCPRPHQAANQKHLSLVIRPAWIWIWHCSAWHFTRCGPSYRQHSTEANHNPRSKSCSSYCVIASSYREMHIWAYLKPLPHYLLHHRVVQRRVLQGWNMQSYALARIEVLGGVKCRVARHPRVKMGCTAMGWTDTIAFFRRCLDIATSTTCEDCNGERIMCVVLISLPVTDVTSCECTTS